MSTREHWKECADPSNININFKWQQCQWGYKYERLTLDSPVKTLLNHFEFHQEISDKQNLLNNLSRYCEQLHKNVFEYTPTTFVLDFNDSNCENCLNNFIKFYSQHLPSALKQKYPDLTKYVKELKRKIRVPMASQQSGDRRNSNFTRPLMTECLLLFGDDSSYLWLLKPTFLNRGRGIHVFSGLDTLVKLVNQYLNGQPEQDIED